MKQLKTWTLDSEYVMHKLQHQIKEAWLEEIKNFFFKFKKVLQW